MELSRLGRYELITRIGQGGMAEVQLAVQRGPAGFEKLVVVKLIHEKLAQEKTFVDMLLDEARVAALVKHPNVVDIYDLGHVDGRYFIAMEYLEGEPLLALLRAGRDGTRLDALSTARLIADTAEGLDAAHELRSLAGEPMGLVHHDVSLGNIVVLYNGQVKLVDFGVARASQHAGSLKVHGKIGYMAPEKLRGKPGDRRSDVWSLGVVLWEALTLRRLFRANSERETAQMVCELEVPLPSTVCPDVPVDADAIVMRALERDPDMRYGTAKELSDDLETMLAAHQYGRQNKIATYMQSTFASHMVARRNLMKEVATRGFASADVLDAAFDEKHSIPGAVEIRFKRKTESPTPRRSLVTEVPIADGTPIQSVDEIVERRRRNSFAMVAEGTPSQITPHPDHVARHIPVAQVVQDELAVIRSQVPREGDEPPPPPDPDAQLIREQPTAELAPEVLDALARKSVRLNTPTGIEALRTEVSIRPFPDEEPAPALAVQVEPRRVSFAILLALGVVLAAILGFFVIKYL
ncbi:MAG: serine/threonine protein kinase [Myxococcota bacterium]|nr:serine/threonine protein kinase [Myxococcota bacterium]